MARVSLGDGTWDDYVAFLGDARVALQNGQWDAAATAARSAIAVKENHADAYVLLGTALVSSGDFDAALEAGEQAGTLCPSAPALVVQSRALLGLGRTAHALERADAAIAMGGDALGQAWRARGVALGELGDAAASANAFRESLRADPGKREVRLAWVAALIASKRTSVVIVFFALLLVAWALAVVGLKAWGWIMIGALVATFTLIAAIAWRRSRKATLIALLLGAGILVSYCLVPSPLISHF